MTRRAATPSYRNVSVPKRGSRSQEGNRDQVIRAEEHITSKRKRERKSNETRGTFGTTQPPRISQAPSRNQAITAPDCAHRYQQNARKSVSQGNPFQFRDAHPFMFILIRNHETEPKFRKKKYRPRSFVNFFEKKKKRSERKIKQGRLRWNNNRRELTKRTTKRSGTIITRRGRCRDSYYYCHWSRYPRRGGGNLKRRMH